MPKGVVRCAHAHALLHADAGTIAKGNDGADAN